MQHIIALLLIALATNLDNLCVGLSLGMAGRRVSAASNLVIALVSGAFAFAACFAAHLLHDFPLATVIGSALLTGFGAWTLVSALRPGEREETSRPEAGRMTLAENLALGAALALNCLPASLAAGISGQSAALLALFVAAFSFATVGCSNLLGLRCALRLSGRLVNALGALTLIALGVWQFCSPQ